jgi:CDP-diacylglycerol--serine O-phosphatidyltransferase
MLEAAFFVLPILLAGLFHHLIVIRYNLFAFLAKPIDNDARFLGKPIFGRQKTWRGLLVVPVLSAIFSLLIGYFIQLPSETHPMLFGFLTGLGYAVAELPNSFLKRRMEVTSGGVVLFSSHPVFYVLDQVDSVLGASLVMIFIYPSSLILVCLVLASGTMFHFIVDQYLHNFGYKNLRNKKQQGES